MATLNETNARNLKKLETGKFSFFDSKNEYQENIKARIPKWIKAIHKRNKTADALYISRSIDFWQKFKKWPNPEQRILLVLNAVNEDHANLLAKEALIDLRNLSRYLNRLEQKGLITRKELSEIHKTKTGEWKRYRKKSTRFTQKGKDLRYKLFGFY